ncbi:hypothetical protein [Lysinibacillus tabacifolii]|uniref:hypothetical protein n=1 Tax=Lysinibacillus tabacifolii TaxID=1173107 RepID=UPI001EE6B963|nr:hypothetical protein [Lysinibacillus tabacifolii]
MDKMKYLIALYVMMMLIIFVNLFSEFMLGGRYSAMLVGLFVCCSFLERSFLLMLDTI